MTFQATSHVRKPLAAASKITATRMRIVLGDENSLSCIENEAAGTSTPLMEVAVSLNKTLFSGASEMSCGECGPSDVTIRPKREFGDLQLGGRSDLGWRGCANTGAEGEGVWFEKPAKTPGPEVAVQERC